METGARAYRTSSQVLYEDEFEWNENCKRNFLLSLLCIYFNIITLIDKCAWSEQYSVSEQNRTEHVQRFTNLVNVVWNE